MPSPTLTILAECRLTSGPRSKDAIQGDSNMKKQAMLALAILLGCDEQESNPPPIDVVDCPRSSAQGGSAPSGCPTARDGAESSGSSGDSSTGEPPPPSCAEFQACAVDCTVLDSADDLAAQRALCASTCDRPLLDSVYDGWLTSWSEACATSDLADQFPDAAQACVDRLDDCEQLEGQEP